MKILRLFPALAFLFFGSAFAIEAPVQPPPSSLPQADFVKFHFRELVTGPETLKTRYPSLVVILVTPTESRIDSLGKGQIKEDSVIEVGSVTKTFTALLAATLVEDKTLTVDAPIAKIWPLATLENGGRAVTLKHLVTHSSGLPRLPEPFRSSDPKQPYREFDQVALLQSLRGVRFLAPVETAVQYSNLGYGLLATALGENRGSTYERALHDRVLRPLKMEDSSLRVESRLRERVVRGVNWENEAQDFWEFDALAGTGALKSTPLDLVKYLRAQLTPTEVPVLTRALVRSQEILFEPGGIAWGWFEGRTPHGARFLWHNGMTYGWSCYAGFSASSGKGLFVCGNAMRILKDSIDSRIDEFGEKLLGQWVDGEPLKVPPPSQKKTRSKKRSGSSKKDAAGSRAR